MIPRSRHQFLFLSLIQYLRATSSREWTDCIDAAALQNDGMPRVSPPRNKANDYESTASSATNALSHMMAEQIEIEMHGSQTTLFEEVDPFRITSAPSVAPSSNPTSARSDSPSSSPTAAPTFMATESAPPTNPPTPNPTNTPTTSPTFSVATIPRSPKEGYFNYDPTSKYGPSKWKNIESINKGDPGYFWHTFDLDEGDSISNDCGSGKRQSPIDLCTKPEESCTETHEMRTLSGDYKMDGELITKQILPNKLRLIMAPRTGEEPDPPQIDFSSNGKGLLDMTNIDLKFPSEHTVCGEKMDGEMQYFSYHQNRKRFVAVSFFLNASDTNPHNEHLQEVIDAFKHVYKEDANKCKEWQKHSSASNFANMRTQGASSSAASNFANVRTQAGSGSSAANSFASGFASGGGRNLHIDDGQDDVMWNTTILESDQQSKLRAKNRRLALKWHPFNPDIQKTVHFWGYSGSFTEPPCTRNIVDWKIMDVPTPISKHQLHQLKHLLFTHVDEKCRRTSVHNADGSVARPTQEELKYYKCTRDDYVSDEERAVCGDLGCDVPYGSGLHPYYEPLVDATGPPTKSPST